MNEINEKVFKLINKLLETPNITNLKIEFNDSYYSIRSKGDKVGTYRFIKTNNGVPVWTLSIVGTRYPREFIISEIEEYHHDKEEYRSYRRDELYDEMLLKLIGNLDILFIPT